MTYRSVTAIVLAAGEASRMGKSKLTLPFGSSTVVGSTIGAVLASSVDDVLVVVGYHGNEVRSAVPDECTIVENPDPSRGNASSLAVGIGTVADTGAVMVVPGDIPGVSSATIDLVADAWRGGACVAALVEYSDGPGHPLLVDRSMFDVVGALEGSKTLWRLVEGLDPEVVRRVRVAEPKPLDINRESDYLTALRILDSDAV